MSEMFGHGPSGERCGKCYFYVGNEQPGESGQCRRSAPHPVHDSILAAILLGLKERNSSSEHYSWFNDLDLIASWPYVYEDHWCGEWKSKAVTNA